MANFTPQSGQLISDPTVNQNGFVPQNGQLVTNADQPQSPQSTGNPILDFLGGIAKPFIQTGKTIGGGVYEGARALDQAAGAPVSKAMGNTSDYTDSQGNPINDPFLSQQELQQYDANPVGQVLKQAGNSAAMASWGVPAGQTIKGAVALGGLSGGLNGLGQDNVTPMSELTSILTGAGTGGILKGAGALLNKGGQVVEDAGNDLALKGLKPSPSQLTTFKNTTGMDLGDFLAKNGITDNFQQAADQGASDLQKQFDDIAVNSGKTIPSSSLDATFNPRIQALQKSVIPSLQSKADDLQTVLSNLKSKYGNNINVGDLTTERRAVDDMLGDKSYTLPVEQASYLNHTRDALQEAIQNGTQGLTGSNGMNLDQLGTALQHYYAFQKIANTAINKGRGSSIPGFVNTSLAGLGSILGGGIPGAIAGWGLGKATQSPLAIGAAVKGMQGAGRGIQNLSSAPINAGALEAMKRLIRTGAVNGVNSLVNGQ